MLQEDGDIALPFITWHHKLNYCLYGNRCGPLDTSRNWTHVIIRSKVSRNGAPLRFFMVWIEDVESFSPDLHEAMYSHLFGHRGNFLPEDARMGVDMRTSQYVVSADSEHRVASMAAMIQPLCLVASCEFCQMQNYIQL